MTITTYYDSVIQILKINFFQLVLDSLFIEVGYITFNTGDTAEQNAREFDGAVSHFYNFFKSYDSIMAAQTQLLLFFYTPQY